MLKRFAWQRKYFLGLLLVVFFGVGLPVSAQTPPPPPPPLPPFPAPALTFSASPTTISVGQSATLSWSSTDTMSCVASGAWSGSRALSGSESVNPTETSIYTLNCAGSFLGNTEENVTVTVTPLAPDTTNPTKPMNLVGTAISSSQINLSWVASADPVVAGQMTSGIAEYRIERCQGKNCTNFVQIGTSTGTIYSDTGLFANTQYRYRVRAVDGAGNISDYSSVIRKTTLR